MLALSMQVLSMLALSMLALSMLASSKDEQLLDYRVRPLTGSGRHL